MAIEEVIQLLDKSHKLTVRFDTAAFVRRGTHVEVLRELKHIDEDIEVIMLTAYETLETARQALRLGAREYLNKPFDIAALRTAARRALGKRRTNQELKSAHARLQELQAGQAPVLIRIETQAGHGAGKPTAKIIEEAADKLAFIAAHLGSGPAR